MFDFIKNTFKKIYSHFASKISLLLRSDSLDQDTLYELEKLLLAADTGVSTTRYIIDRLKNETLHKSPRAALQSILLDLLAMAKINTLSRVILLVGINGSGKTTCAGKLAHYYKEQGKRVLLVAADTFRAAATAQLALWAERAGVSLVEGKSNQDPASIVYLGCQKFTQEAYDVVIIDTAGRLQAKVNLMHELERIKKVVAKSLPHESVSVLLVIDAMLGQNSFEQALLFHESVDLAGVVLTKMDGTAKGGILFSIAHTLQMPVLFIAHGENIADMMPFDAESYVHELLENRL